MVHRESFLSSMRDLSQDSNTCSRSGDNKNLQYNQNGFSMRAPPPEEAYLGHERDFLKQTMLQHEAVFKNQVYLSKPFCLFSIFTHGSVFFFF